MIWLLGGYMWMFIHRPFEVWPVLGSLQIERVYMILMLGFWAVAPGKGWISNRLHAALFAFFIVLILSWLASPYASLVFDTVENYCKVAIFYLLVVTCVRDEKDLRRLLYMYLTAVGLYMTHSFYERLNGRINWAQGVSRMVGVDVTFCDPNSFASGLVYALAMTLPIWYDKPSKFVRLCLVGFTGLVFVCVLLTGSRAGFIGLTVCTALGMFLSGWRIGTLMLLGIGALFIVLLAPGEIQNRLLTLVDASAGPQNAQESASGRLEGFLKGLEAFEKSPLLGHGPDAFRYATGRHGGAHNVYGQVLSELGLLGTLAFAAVLCGFVLNIFEMRRIYGTLANRPRDLPFYIGRAVALNVVLLCVMGWAGHNLYRYFWLWFAAFQIVALHCARVQGPSEFLGRGSGPCISGDASPNASILMAARAAPGLGRCSSNKTKANAAHDESRVSSARRRLWPGELSGSGGRLHLAAPVRSLHEPAGFRRTRGRRPNSRDGEHDFALRRFAAGAVDLLSAKRDGTGASAIRRLRSGVGDNRERAGRGGRVAFFRADLQRLGARARFELRCCNSRSPPCCWSHSRSFR